MIEERCENMEWNQVGSDFNCETIDALPKDFQKIFCETYGDASLSCKFFCVFCQCSQVLYSNIT